MTETKIVATPGSQDVALTRIFDAPRELVYRVYTDPELLPDWWGPDQYTTTVDRMDVRDGGSWRFIQRGADGTEHAFHGVYHTADGERIVQTFEYEGAPGHVMLETTVFADIGGGRTKVTNTSVFQSPAERDATLATGMTDGAVRS